MRTILSIQAFGAKLGRTGNRFAVSSKEAYKELVSDDVSQILLYGGAISLSTSAIRLAIKKGIPIFFMGRGGRPYGMIAPFMATGTVITRREQYLALNDERGLHLARAFVEGKLRNQERLLRLRSNDVLKVERERGLYLRSLADGIARLASSLDRIEAKALGDYVAKAMEVEALAARSYYWKGFALLLPHGFSFDGREHRGARDPVNCLLNYGYGFLLSRVMNALLLAGLDPYAGFLHADRPGRPSLALDLMEEFRQPLVDHAVLKLLRLKELKPDGVLEEDGRLSKGALEKLLKALKERMEQRIEEATLESALLEQARSISRFLRGELRRYKPFVI